MARGQGAWCVGVQCGVGLTWVMVAVCSLHLCHAYSIDQLIVRAMAQPPAQGLHIDEKEQTVRVDLDMVFSLEEWNNLFDTNGSKEEGHVVQKRQAIVENARRRYWPHGIIHYSMDRNAFSRRDVRVLKAAMDEWMRHTCVKFLPAPRGTLNRIYFKDGDGCASNVGMFHKPQAVTLSRGCRTKGVVIHELGHVLGFNHEQTRPDRDQYVKIHWQNIPTTFKYNFRKYSWRAVRDLGVPYDYLSIMHYGKDTFTGNGRHTIETLDPRYQSLIGNRRGLSFRDIKSANIVYNCRPPRDRCSLLDEDCPGEGFVSKDCSCWCPTPDTRTHPDMPYYVCQPAHRPEVSSASDSATIQDAAAWCEDQHENCQVWAERGECSHNSAYMHASCRKACALCHAGEQRACRDDYSGCDFWKENGYCGVPTPFGIFITRNCQRSCNVCQTAGPRPQVRKFGCERQCHDEHKQCQEWASRGECSATSDYMLRHCRKACDACCTPQATLSSPKRPH